MSSLSEGDKPTIDEKNLQTTFVKQVRQLFDYPLRSNNPQPSFIILCILGFAFLRVVGINCAHAWTKDLTISITHSGFFTYVEICMKFKDGESWWITLALFQRRWLEECKIENKGMDTRTRNNYKTKNVLDPFFKNLRFRFLKDKRSIPMLGDNLDIGGNEVWTTFC